NFSTLTTGELTQLMGRAGRRGIDVIGHGAILKESDVEVGTIYEVAMGPTLVVESKFLPSYNMALNLLRVYTPEEAEALMQRSFGQFQKRLAAAEAGERLTNVRERLADIRRMWDDPQISIDDVAQYFKVEDRRRAIRIELRRLRREAGAERRGRRGRRNTRAMGSAGRIAHRLEIEAKGLLERQRKLKLVRSTRFGELLQKYGEIRTLQPELEGGQGEEGRSPSPRTAPLPDTGHRSNRTNCSLALLPLRRHGAGPRRAEPALTLARLHRFRLSLVVRGGAGQDPASGQRRHR